MQVELLVINVATQIISAQRLQWWRAEPIRPPAGPALVVNGLTGCQAQPGCRFRTSVNAVQWVKRGSAVRSGACLLGVAWKRVINATAIRSPSLLAGASSPSRPDGRPTNAESPASLMPLLNVARGALQLLPVPRVARGSAGLGRAVRRGCPAKVLWGHCLGCFVFVYL